MPYSDELLFEKDLIKFLYTSCGWEKEVIKYPTEEDLIKNWANILFENNKEIDKLNNQPLTDGEMRQILSEIETLKTPYMLNTFINGKTVTIKRDNPNDKLHFGKPVSLKIYDRMEIAAGSSRYQIVEQPQFKTTNNVYPNRRGDIMLLINGMPVYHIELKKSNVSISHAQVQIEKYMLNNAFTGIFSLIQIFVAMNPEEAVYYANPGRDGKFNPLYYFHWTNSDNEYINDWDKFTHSLLSIPRAHEMIGFYTVPDASDGILKVLRPYQVYAAAKVSNIVSGAHWTKEEQKAGYIWHTTGSGKTLTSFKTAQLIANMSKADKVVFLIDRVELGEQSYLDYVNFANVDENIYETSNTDALVRLLKSDDLDEKVIVTSIQKMYRIREGEVPHTVLDKIKDKKIVFIVDECHRDQDGEMHQSIEYTFPTAMFFGYTGTPDHDRTVDIFGSEKHRYTIADGIRDNNVLGFDPRKVCIFSDSDIRKNVALNLVHASTPEEAMADPDKREAFLTYMNMGKDPYPMTAIEKEVPKSQFETDIYREAVVEDIIDQWAIRSSNSTFHAIFATSSIPEAIRYYQLFAKLKEEGKHNLKVTAVFDPSDDNGSTSIFKMQGITQILNDYCTMFGNFYDNNHYSNFKKDVCLRLAHKDPYINTEKDKQINIVIVVDQLLTGFDSKWINQVYFDKVMYGKNLIQAASRTNRLFGSEKKHGTVFFYRYPHTMYKNFEEAVNSYSGNKPFGVFVNKLEANLKMMNQLYGEIVLLFENAGISNFEKIDSDLGWRQQFAKLFSSFNDRLDSAKLQGFRWEQTTYTIVNGDKITKVKVDIEKEIYFILVQRYKELFVKTPHEDEPPYDINPHITEVQTDTINNEYMNSRFKKYLRNLNDGDQDAKKKALDELHKSFASLSQEDQIFARQFLDDIENGLAIDSSKDLTDYIAEYKYKAYNGKVHEIADGLGLDFDKLNNLISVHPVESNINEFNRYNELFNDLDIEKAKHYLEDKLGIVCTKNREVRIAADEYLRDIILNGVK